MGPALTYPSYRKAPTRVRRSTGSPPGPVRAGPDGEQRTSSVRNARFEENSTPDGAETRVSATRANWPNRLARLREEDVLAKVGRDEVTHPHDLVLVHLGGGA